MKLIKRIPKKVIYWPLYVMAVAALAYLLHWYLNIPDKPAPEPVAVRTPIDDFIDCFERYKRSVGGVVHLTRGEELRPFLDKGASEECMDRMCRMMRGVENRQFNSVEFYSSLKRGNRCQRRMLDYITSLHHEKVVILPNEALFYHSGEYGMTNRQKDRLSVFIRNNAELFDNFGIVLIARASRVGEDAPNRRLSQQRAQDIQSFLKDEFIIAPQIDYEYFGADPPQLDLDLADRYGLTKSQYRHIRYGPGSDTDYSLRLNQSVIVVLYAHEDDPFGISKEI